MTDSNPSADYTVPTILETLNARVAAAATFVEGYNHTKCARRLFHEQTVKQAADIKQARADKHAALLRSHRVAAILARRDAALSELRRHSAEQAAVYKRMQMLQEQHKQLRMQIKAIEQELSAVV